MKQTPLLLSPDGTDSKNHGQEKGKKKGVGWDLDVSLDDAVKH